MKTKLLPALILLMSVVTISYGQTTSEVPYCAARICSTTTYYNNRIQAVNIGTLSNITGTNYYNGSDYVYFNNLPPVSVPKGVAIPATFTLSRSDGEMDALWVYIDYNLNNNFEQTEYVGMASQAQFTVASSFGPNVTMSISLNIPPAAQNGQTRMRIIYTSDDALYAMTTPTPCNSNVSPFTGPPFNYGEVEDYDVLITAPPVAPPVASFTVPAAICKSQTLTLTDNSTNSPSAWSWTLTGGAPSTSTVQNPAVTYSATGTYTILLSSSNAGGTSAVVSKTLSVSGCTGIEEVGEATAASVYPNPGNGYFNLELAAATQVCVYDVQGKLVLQKQVLPGKQQLDLHSQPSGLYILSLFSNGHSQHLKLLKE